MTTPKRHHFVPQFYLDQWRTDRNGSKDHLHVYKRENDGSIRYFRSATGNVGCEGRLYTFQKELLWVSLDYVDLETTFFQKIDDSASIVHTKLLSHGVEALTVEDRNFFGIFIKSLLERNPHRINSIIAVATPVDPQLTAFALTSRLHMDAIIRNQVLAAITAEIMDQEFLRTLIDMSWNLVTILPCAEHFVTSDNPVVLNSGSRADPIHMLSLALSPKHLLIIQSSDNEFYHKYLDLSSFLHSTLVAKQANNYIFSSQPLTDTECMSYSKLPNLMQEAKD